MTPCKPITFKDFEVRAILDGRKTQTRRVLNRRNTAFNGSKWFKNVSFDDCDWSSAWVDDGPSPAGNAGPYLHAQWPYGRLCDGGTDELLWVRIYPLTQPGDLLWVRERLRATGNNQVVYDADDSVHPDAEWVWKNWTLPSIHCPRGLSRIMLEVTAVKVQRLQDISEDDAKAEGAQPQFASGWPSREHIGGFYKIWASIHGPDAWDANPWVAAYSFRRVMG